MNPSPTETISASISTQTNPFLRPLQINKTDPATKIGKNQRFPLKSGITRSKTRLLRSTLMNLNRLRSTDCSQCIPDRIRAANTRNNPNCCWNHLKPSSGTRIDKKLCSNEPAVCFWHTLIQFSTNHYPATEIGTKPALKEPRFSLQYGLKGAVAEPELKQFRHKELAKAAGYACANGECGYMER